VFFGGVLDMRNFIIFFLLSVIVNCKDLYFPPINSEDWETINISELQWNSTKVDGLYDFLEEKNTKAFLVLKDGKIVLEKYFGDFGRDSLWYWASAGKTLTAALVGIAQDEGYLSIDDRTSDYLGKHWTSLPEDKEDLITIRHQLTMTSGLDDGVKDPYCTLPECLIYKEVAGSRWAYHNAPYTLLEQVVVKATGQTYNQYFSAKIRNEIGMNGLWVKSGYNNIYLSNARSMARFGLMVLAGGNWNGKEIIKDKRYFIDMLVTSQELNKSYGYLWWLNGKESYMLPSLQIKFAGYLFTNAPSDVVCALGKNGQGLFVSFKNNLIVVRMGEVPDVNELPFLFFNEMWGKLNEVINYETFVEESDKKIEIYPVPAKDFIVIRGLKNDSLRIMNYLSQTVYSSFEKSDECQINISELPNGIYFVEISDVIYPFIKLSE